ncbi:PREDICTED: uncharacterized PE-PGRS family protein PE_PGRS33-like [Pseudopodoces humilis]|uniref:uncharacterized PE-PGRS family protein PE_PGRS33-like n=1 Tax=Pseudopodoces humilis TaxID=181119 RepID=UPI0006B764CA|nr:PREDICTED: uncharacterized PE-PGRS family protein PE_PGRS33-like [Pseudopodoces humilis]
MVATGEPPPPLRFFPPALTRPRRRGGGSPHPDGAAGRAGIPRLLLPRSFVEGLLSAAGSSARRSARPQGWEPAAAEGSARLWGRGRGRGWAFAGRGGVGRGNAGGEAGAAGGEAGGAGGRAKEGGSCARCERERSGGGGGLFSGAVPGIPGRAVCWDFGGSEGRLCLRGTWREGRGAVRTAAARRGPLVASARGKLKGLWRARRGAAAAERRGGPGAARPVAAGAARRRAGAIVRRPSCAGIGASSGGAAGSPILRESRWQCALPAGARRYPWC